MTVPTNDSREQYLGNGATTVFPYAFKIFEDADLEVYLTEADGAQTLLTLGTDYAVTGAGNEDGGSITYPVLGDPLDDDETLTILRVIDITQETDLRNQGAYYPEVVEDALDRGRMIDQQQQEEIDRSLRLTESGDDYDADGHRIKNIGAPLASGDAVSREYVDGRFYNDVITKTSGQWDAKSKRLTNLSDPVSGSDAATKAYSDSYADQKIADESSSLRQLIDANSEISAEGDANLQKQMTGSVPLEASAFSPISWHSQVVSNSVDIPDNVNAWSFGPVVTISPSATVTIGENSFYTISNGDL